LVVVVQHPHQRIGQFREVGGGGGGVGTARGAGRRDVDRGEIDRIAGAELGFRHVQRQARQIGRQLVARLFGHDHLSGSAAVESACHVGICFCATVIKFQASIVASCRDRGE